MINLMQCIIFCIIIFLWIVLDSEPCQEEGKGGNCHRAPYFCKSKRALLFAINI